MSLRNDLTASDQHVLRGDAWQLEVTIPGEGALGGTWEFRVRRELFGAVGAAIGSGAVSDAAARTVLYTLTGIETESLVAADWWYSARESTTDMTYAHGLLRVVNTA